MTLVDSLWLLMAIDGASECLIACSNLTQLATLWRVQMNKLVTVYYNQSLDTALAALYNDKLGRDYGSIGLSFGHPSSSVATLLQDTSKFTICMDSRVTMTSLQIKMFHNKTNYNHTYFTRPFATCYNGSVALENGRQFMPQIVLIESTLNLKTICFDHIRNIKRNLHPRKLSLLRAYQIFFHHNLATSTITFVAPSYTTELYL